MTAILGAVAAIAGLIAAALKFFQKPKPEVQQAQQLGTVTTQLEATDAEDARVQRSLAAGDRVAAVGLSDDAAREAAARAPDPDSRD